MPKRAKRPNVTREAFNEAVKQLNAENKAISVRNVRAITGGANETIGTLIREYQRNVMTAGFKDKMPETFQESVIKACLALYELFEGKFTADRVELQDQFDKRHLEIISPVMRPTKRQKRPKIAPKSSKKKTNPSNRRSNSCASASINSPTS